MSENCLVKARRVVSWTEGSTRTTLSFEGEGSMREIDIAYAHLRKRAYQLGYTKPKWWQVSRWGDSVIEIPTEEELCTK